jgi:hypothetical protein
VKKILILLAVLIVVGIIGDSALRSLASNKVAEELQDALDLNKEPEVAIGGFPFLFEAISGDLESVTISAQGLEKDGVLLTDLEVTLNNVKVSIPQLLSGKSKKVKIGSAEGTARLTTEDLASALGEPGFNVGVFDPTNISVSGTTLTVGPTELELPSIVNGIDYTEAKLEGNVIALSFETRRTSIGLASAIRSASSSYRRA